MALVIFDSAGMQDIVGTSTVLRVSRCGLILAQSLVCVAAYVVGEYGKLVLPKVPALELFRLLNERFPAANPATKGLLMTAYMKLFLMDPGNQALRTAITANFTRYSKHIDSELQQVCLWLASDQWQC
jgi:hypothetical protein